MTPTFDHPMPNPVNRARDVLGRLPVLAFWGIVLFLVTFAFPAFAQNAPAPADIDFTVRDTDVSVKLLRSVLGDWGSSSVVPVVGDLFRILNSGALVLGIILTTYITGVGVLRSGSDGEFLGRGWSKLFVPARLVIGNAMLAPTASGYSFIQIGVLWLAVQGIALGNAGWTAVTKSLVDRQGEIVAAQLSDRESVGKLMRSIVLAEACRASILKTEMARQNRPADDPMPVIDLNVRRGTNLYTLAWGSTTPNHPAYSQHVCGHIVIQLARPENGMANPIGQAAEWTSRGWTGNQLYEIRQRVQDAQVRAIQDTARVIRPPVEGLVYGQGAAGAGANQLTPASFVQGLKSVTDSYIASVGRHSQAALEDLNGSMTTGFKQEAAKAGWIGAGQWFYQVARLNTEFTEIARSVPEIRTEGLGAYPGGAIVDQLVAQQLDALVTQGVAEQARLDRVDAGDNTGGVWGWFAGMTNSAGNSLAQAAGETIGIDPNSSTNALVQLKNTGDNLLTIAELAFVGKQAIDALPAGKVAAAVGSASGVVGKFKGFIGTFLGESAEAALSVGSMLMVFGLISVLSFAAILAFWLPMVPLMIWLGGVLGWLISVVEMVVAAPLWAVAHIHPEGEGMAGKYGANGYMIIVEVFLRPILMIVGLVMSMMVLDPFLRFISTPFWNTMNTVNAGNAVGFITIVAFILIYVGFCVSLVHRMFTFIHLIPNSVLRWIGAHSNSFDQGERIAGDIHNSVLGYFNSGTRAAGTAGKAAGFDMVGGRAKALAEKAGTGAGGGSPASAPGRNP
jgi:conjugal transfer/type IV secretion protein DotA/TraY